MIEERHLGWLGHIHRINEDRLVKELYEARTLGKKVGKLRIRRINRQEKQHKRAIQ